MENFRSHYEVHRLVFLILLLSTLTTQHCETFGQTSSTSVLTQREEHFFWWTEWVTSHEYPIIYNYTVCTNSMLEFGKHLEIKNGTKENINYILFQNSTIPTVPVGVFTPFTNVTDLYLNNSGIQSIHPGAFGGMAKLEKLYLQDNEIEILERGTLNYLSNLKKLDLSRNHLMQLEDKSLFGLLVLEEIYLKDNILAHQNTQEFVTLQNLEILDLSGNNLLHFNPKERFKNLHSLYLSNNTLENFNFDIFENINNLNVLDLSCNNLTTIDFSVLSGNHKLINISNNRITEIQSWIKLKNIEKVDLRKNNIQVISNSIGPEINYLYLSWNQIERLELFTFGKLENLIELDLSHNMLKEISQELFSNLSHLEILNLSGNKINVLTVGSFKNLVLLKYLNLSSNLISDLEYGTFAGLNALEELYIDHNSLTVIHENSFHVLVSLKTLFLNDNLLSMIYVQDLLEHLRNLKVINLQNNNWECSNLFKVVQEFKEKSIDILNEFDTLKTANVFGISCKSKEIEELGYVSHKYKDISAANLKSTNNRNEGKENFAQVEFKSSRFYDFFSKFSNLSFYNFFNETFRSLMFIKYLNSGIFEKFFKNKFHELQVTEAPHSILSKSQLDIFIEQNKDLMRHLQMLSNRIIGFIAIMVTILLVIILLFLFIFLKPNTSNVKNKLNENVESYNILQNQFELK